MDNPGAVMRSAIAVLPGCVGFSLQLIRSVAAQHIVIHRAGM
jgi:hypothetical protein